MQAFHKLKLIKINKIWHDKSLSGHDCGKSGNDIKKNVVDVSSFI